MDKMWPGKANCGNEVLAFLVSATKEGRRSRRRQLQMHLALKVIKQPTTIFEFGFAFYYWLFPKENQSASFLVVPVVGFFKVHLFCGYIKSSTFDSESFRSRTDRLAMSNLILGSTQITSV